MPALFCLKAGSGIMDAADRVRALLEPTVEALGFELVRVAYGGGQRPRLQIMAERADGSMTIDDCALLSRELSALLDVEDPIAGEYVLEVSSPGIDRPLTRRKDFERWAGFEARIETETPVDGRRRFTGRLSGLEGEEVRMVVDGAELRLPLAGIVRARLVMTDALLAAARGTRP